ncbi:MAG TPA: DUF11 domain-containing protein [Roseiflexaceae bacterium]|nr:DUF11 domain-containing protein [Roseiflexaceae bacterium]
MSHATKYGVIALAIGVAATLLLMPRPMFVAAAPEVPLVATATEPPTLTPTADVPTTVPTTQVPTTVPTTPSGDTPTPIAPSPTANPTRPPEDPIANPRVVKQADRTVARVGEDVTFSIEVSNPERYSAENVVVTDALPGYFDLLGVSATRGDVSVNGLLIRVSLGTVEPGEVVVITVRARVNQTAPTEMVNGVTLTTDSDSDIPTDNNSSVVVVRLDELIFPPDQQTATALALTPSPGVGSPTPTASPTVGSGGSGTRPTARPNPRPTPPRMPNTAGEDGSAPVLFLLGLAVIALSGSVLVRRRNT